MKRSPLALVAAFVCALGSPAHARSLLDYNGQCVPFARQASGIQIYGDAWTWWDQAHGRYKRGDLPKVGSVIAFSRQSRLPLGHVAVVKKVVDDRHILLDHANWSSPGLIERGVLAEDVSPEGDWSAVKVWYRPTKALGNRVNVVSGFIYPQAAPAKFELAGQPADSTNVSKAFDTAVLQTKRAG
jgi:hypothetical protein